MMIVKHTTGSSFPVIKKSDLQGGDIVTYRDGRKRIVDILNNRLVYLNNFSSACMHLNNYNDDLMDIDNCSQWDIVEVFRPTTKETFITKREIKKMTVKEICEKLGYDVEIIKEDK